MILGTIAVHRVKRLDFGNQMATFPTVANFGSKPGPISSPHGSPIPLVTIPFNLNTFSWKPMKPPRPPPRKMIAVVLATKLGRAAYLCLVRC